MKTMNRFKVLFFFLIAAYLLAACGSNLSQPVEAVKGPKVEPNVVAFTGIVEAINDTQWTVGGQTLTLSPGASLDPNITVGDQVTVEANVSADGAVVAMKVESSAPDDVAATPSTAAEVSIRPDPVSSASPGLSSTQAPGTVENEIFGVVEAISADTVAVNGIVYRLAGFTEIKDALTAGDPVKLHVIVNADGTLTVREIEKSTVSLDDSGNSNGSDDGPTHDTNDDHSNDHSGDDHGNDDNSDDHGGNSGSGDD